MVHRRLHLLSMYFAWVFIEKIYLESQLRYPPRQVTKLKEKKSKARIYRDDHGATKLTSFYVGQPWWCHPKRIHHRVIIETTFRMPREPILVEKIPGFLSRQFGFLFPLFPSPVDEASGFGVLRDVFGFFFVYFF